MLQSYDIHFFIALMSDDRNHQIFRLYERETDDPETARDYIKSDAQTRQDGFGLRSLFRVEEVKLMFSTETVQ